jgi:hypothetical protein
MDYNVVLSYNYAKRKRRRQRTNAPPSQAILMAMRRHWSDTCSITQCSMTRASPEATGCRHRATTRSVTPWRPPGQQQTKQRCNMYPLWWPFQWPSWCGGTIVSIAWCRRFVAFIKATKRHHRASSCSDITNQTCQHMLSLTLHCEKGSSWHVGPIKQ